MCVWYVWYMWVVHGGVCVPTGWKGPRPPTLDPGSTTNTQTPDSLHLAKGQGKSRDSELRVAQLGKYYGLLPVIEEQRKTQALSRVSRWGRRHPSLRRTTRCCPPSTAHSPSAFQMTPTIANRSCHGRAQNAPFPAWRERECNFN